MMKKILIGLGALALLVGAGAAWAHGPGRHFMGGQMLKQRIAKMEDTINATPQQRQQIDAEVNAVVDIFKAQRQKGQNVHGQLMQLLTSDSLSEAQVTALAKQHADQIEALAAQIAPHVVKVHDVLTPAQRQQLADHFQEMRQKHQNRGPQGGFGGPGE